MVSITTRTIRSVDVRHGEGRCTLRISLALDENGEPETLVLATGFGTGPQFHRPSWGEAPIAIPATSIPALRDALESLGLP